jgi:glutamate-ammonia-ligase adenylyltransferase
MPNNVWEQAVAKSADPSRARDYARQLFPSIAADFESRLSQEQAQILAALFSGSRALSELLITRPEWISVVTPEHLRNPRQRQGLRREVAGFVGKSIQTADYQSAFKQLREFKNREMLRIAARDLAHLGNVVEVIEEISNVADVCIHAVFQLCFAQLRDKHGPPYTREITGEWEQSKFAILGMGKLGGQELNYSSDIDVLFVYSGEGEVFKTAPTNGKPNSSRSLSNHQFYARLSEAIIAECTRMTSEGFLYRIDLRLRPEGKTAPLARSLTSYETYYAQWGQTWERMMLIKTRCVGGDESLGAEFLEMIQPFRYPRSISEQIPREVAQMKARIENEVIRAGELERNVKLGRGGIREIEFLVQTQQVLNAGRMPFLQNPRTLPTLEKLADYHLVSEEESTALAEAYCFLRNVEHRLQMEDNRQTHTIPVSTESRSRLARLMGFASLEKFEKELRRHNKTVRSIYDRFITLDEKASAETLPREVNEHREEWLKILERHSFRNPGHCVKLVQEFVQGPGFGHVSTRTVDNAMQLLQLFLELTPASDDRNAPPEPYLSDPDRVLARLDAYVSNYGARSTLYEAWVGNTSLFRLLLLAFDRSEFLAELAVRDPDLVDEIEQSGQLRRKRTRDQILQDLRQGIADENQHEWVRRYYHAEQMRLGLRDILGLADPRQTQEELSALADAFLTYALEVIQKKHRLKIAPFAIFGLGKLGGRELSYGSDLDIIFVAPDGSNLPPLQKMAVELMDLLSRRTEQGTTFLTDARLRPDGDKGLLVNTVGAYREYYLKRAMLWEIQSLSRFRPVAGDARVLEAFSEMAVPFINFAPPVPGLNAYSPQWKEEILRMRMRIEKERTPVGKSSLAIKTGSGGLMDVEFVAQALCLENGWHEPNTLRAIERAGKEKVLLAESATEFSENYRKLMQVERILRRWSFEPESILPSEEAPLYRVSVRCGFQNPEQFTQAVGQWRIKIRTQFDAFFSGNAALAINEHSKSVSGGKNAKAVKRKSPGR